MPKRTNQQWASSPRVRHARLAAVVALRNRGYSYKEIAVAMNTTPEPIRRYEAKARRISQCNCPSSFDHTAFGHLPNCPANYL